MYLSAASEYSSQTLTDYIKAYKEHAMKQWLYAIVRLDVDTAIFHIYYDPDTT
jgi:hypothetical protein